MVLKNLLTHPQFFLDQPLSSHGPGKAGGVPCQLGLSLPPSVSHLLYPTPHRQKPPGGLVLRKPEP